VLREVAVTVASIIVVLYTASMIHPSEPQRALALSVVNTQAIAADTLIFYGTVVDKSTGKPVRGASVTLARVNADGSLTRVASTVTDTSGTFRISVSPATSGKYQLLVQAEITTGTVRDAFPLSALAGHAYGVRAELINREYFSLLPLPGY
jgi:hypothetical protein